MGKISQAAVMAAAAYNSEATFRQQTGIEKSRLIRDKEHHDTKVGCFLQGRTQTCFASAGQ